MLNRISNFVLHRFPLFIAGYFLLQILIRVTTTGGVEIDESEQLMLSQYFSLGYNAQPPLYTWVQRLFFFVFGETIFALSFLKNILLFLTYIFTYKTGVLVCKDKTLAALGAFSLVFLPQIVWEAQIDQIHTVLLTTSTAGLFFAYFYTLKKQGPFGFILIGLACACGVLAKYNFVLVILALMAATLFVHGYRQKIFTRNLVLSVIVTIVLVLPHMLWFLANQDLATSETMVRMSLDQKGNYGPDILHGSMELLGAYIAFVIPFVVVYAGCFRGAFRCRLTRPAGILIAYIIASLAAVFAVILLMQVTNIKERWLQPYLFIVPMLAFTLTDIKLIPAKRLNFFISMGLIACALVMLIQPMRVLLVDLGQSPHRANFPFEQVSMEIRGRGFDRGLILTEDKFIGGNLKLFLKDSTLITPSIPLQKYRPHKNVLVVWQTVNPVGFLDEMNLEPASEVVTKKLPFRHSKKFFYDVSFQLYTAHDF